MCEIIKNNEFRVGVSEMILRTFTINSEYLWKCHMNPSFSDVTLLVEDKEFPVLRFVLSLHSTFFEAFFNGNFEEARKSKILLENINVQAFGILVRYMYSGDIIMESSQLEDILELLSLAHFLGIPAAVQTIADYLERCPRDVSNVVETFNKAVLFNLEKLQKTLLNYMLSNQEAFFAKKIFMNFNEAALSIILDSDEWTVNESTIVQRLAEWLSINPTSKQKELLQKICLPLVDTKVLLKELMPKKLFNDDEIFDTVVKRSERRYQKSRCIFERAVVTLTGQSIYYDTNYELNMIRFLFKMRSQIISRVEINIARIINDCIYFIFEIPNNFLRPVYEIDRYVVTFKLKPRVSFFCLCVPENIDVYGSDISVW